MEWTQSAQTRIGRVPGFVRRMVKKRVEADVREKGRLLVTQDDIARIAKERFKNGMPAGMKNLKRPVNE